MACIYTIVHHITALVMDCDDLQQGVALILRRLCQPLYCSRAQSSAEDHTSI